MSLYSSLTQVLAPFAAKINGLLTGWDGTKYTTPGEAVRQQIADLHVLMGDEPGTAISASAVAYGDSDVSTELDELNGRFISIGYTEAISANILNPDEVEAGRITSSSSAVLHTGTYDTDYRTTGFMPVEGGKKYGFFVKTTLGDIVNCAVANIWAYDSAKSGLSYIGSISYNADGTSYITAPENAAYIRASIVSITFTNFDFTQFSETDGNPPSTLVPYSVSCYLSGYVRSAEFAALESDVDDIQDLIDDNFVDNYESLTGTSTDNKYINGRGVVTDVASAYTINTFVVSPNTPVKITAKAYTNNYYFGFYDSSDNFISGLKATGSGMTEISDYAAIAPENSAKLVAVEYNDYASVYAATSKTIISARPWTGKKWVVFGDSLTEQNNRTTKHYYDYVKEVTGISTYIMGNGGSGYKREYDLGTAFYQRIDDVPTDADVITIFGSFNDLGANYTLGTASDTGTDTIGGCINETLDILFETLPLANVGVVTPTPWVGFNPLSEPNNASAYVDLIIDICKCRSIPCLDLFHCSQLRPWESAFRALAYSKDEGNGVHPDETGHEIIAPRFEAFLKSLLLT